MKEFHSGKFLLSFDGKLDLYVKRYIFVTVHWLSWPLFLAGLIFSIRPLLTVGIILFTFAVLFQLVTLPVEFNASSRALKMLGSSGMLGNDEVKGARKVLTAAALTYVAALASSILQLLRLIILAGGRDRD